MKIYKNTCEIDRKQSVLNADKHSPASSAWSTKRWVRGLMSVRRTADSRSDMAACTETHVQSEDRRERAV